MSDDPKEPEGQAAEATQPDEEERPKLLEVSEEKLKGILAEHERWVKSDGKEGEQADLTYANLQKAKLVRANLQGARLLFANFQGAILIETNFQGATLPGTNFQGAMLIGANFQGAVLQDANLQGAMLIGANLQGAGLTDANLRSAKLGHATLREANLQDADLTDVKGLLAEQLAGANISGATLPGDIAEFKGLDHVTEISKHARNIFLAAIVGCVFSWLTIATTTDVALLTNTASTPLPIIQTQVPIAGFYWAAPAILLALYFYLHFYLQILWEGLASLPAIFPDGRSLDERAYPWLMTSLVREFVLLLTNERRPFTSLKVGISISVAWGLVPFTFVCFWLRYLPRHDWPWTIWHILLIVVTAVFGTVAFQTALATLRGKLRKPQVEATTSIWERWKRKLRSLPYYRPAPLTAIVTIVTVALTVSVSLGAIEGVRISDRKFTDVRTWVPWAFERFGYSTFADLRETDISVKPSDYWQVDEEHRQESVKGANLRGRDLRHADAGGAFLVRANLHRANFKEADLGGANLQGAILLETNLQKVNLFFANLQKTDFTNAHLQEANLQLAKLQKANLTNANLQGANLTNANLQEATLFSANLQGAILVDAQLQGTKFGSDVLRGIKPKGAYLQWLVLLGANLQGARLWRAKFQGAILMGANLQGADLRWAEGLTKEQLDEACGDTNTTLPEYLKGYEMKPCPEEPK